MDDAARQRCFRTRGEEVPRVIKGMVLATSFEGAGCLTLAIILPVPARTTRLQTALAEEAPPVELQGTCLMCRCSANYGAVGLRSAVVCSAQDGEALVDLHHVWDL